jgi:anti-anti-sigma factor
MKIRCDDYEGVTVIAPNGELTADNVDLLREQIQTRLDQNVHLFVVDMEGLQFIDSKGLECLIWLQEQCDDALGQMRLCKPDDTCRRILHVTRLDNRFDVFSDVAQAVKTMR